MILEGRQLINHHHIEVKGNAALIHEPLDVFPVDDVDVGASHQCRPALGFCSDSHGAYEVLEMIPLIRFSRPCVPCYTQRCDDQHPVNLEAVKQQITYGCQCDAGFPKTAVQEDSGGGVCLDVLHRIFLIFMGFVFHPVSLRSAPHRPAHTLESPAAAKACGGKAAAVSAFLPEP
ncbi:hypothetical protein SDC9_139125 [bioreactor metagenome]|uniref:Uncharacterized protein n=1 Tax=bioreactor metagenome TaxID=1076179 RepID=A0A645DRQ8_9ZZZZ